MLNPNIRSLYTSAIVPPPGMVLDEAIATSFSLDPGTLLTIPVHVALLARGDQQETLCDPITVYESLRRVSQRITVYNQRGRMTVPHKPYPLYNLLEKMIVEVTAPRGGVFHPKLWFLRFKDINNSAEPVLRLLILSRNLTGDRSWDLSLQLEGALTGRNRSVNSSLAEFIETLPSLATNAATDGQREQAQRLAEELRRTQWEMPIDIDEISFTVLGLKRSQYRPPKSSRMVVIAPFCTDDALTMLCEKTKPEVLISRPDTLSGLNDETIAKFKHCMVLNDVVETEGLDETTPKDVSGLHAKAYIYEAGWETHIVIGSANATNAALLGSSNVELLVEMVGKKSRWGIDKLLSSEGLGEVLVEFVKNSEGTDDENSKDVLKALESIRDLLVKADLSIECKQVENRWELAIKSTPLVGFDNVAQVNTWPLTVTDTYKKDAKELFGQGVVELGSFDVQSLTGLIAFELVSTENPEVSLRFTLNLPVTGIPDERENAILNMIIRNRDGFLHYLLLLLRDVEGFDLAQLLEHKGKSSNKWGSDSFLDLPLLEEMTRAFSKDPAKLDNVTDVIKRLSKYTTGQSVIPPEFLTLWQVFEQALEIHHGHR